MEYVDKINDYTILNIESNIYNLGSNILNIINKLN